MTSDITVTRIHDEHGSHIEPPLDQTWPKLDQLRWLAAVVAHDTGLPVKVVETPFNFGGEISVTVGRSVRSLSTFQRAWLFLTAAEIGATEATRDVYDGRRSGLERALEMADTVGHRSDGAQRVAALIRAELERIEAPACPACNGSGVVDDPDNTGCYGCGQGGAHESWCGLAPCPRGCPIPAPGTRPAGTEVPR